MKTKTKVTTLLILSAMATPFVSCGRSEKAPEEKTPAPAKPVVMDVPSGTKAPATVPVDTIPGQTRLKVTCRCLATSQPEMLDLMPRDVRSARRDTALLGSINRGERVRSTTRRVGLYPPEIRQQTTPALPRQDSMGDGQRHKISSETGNNLKHFH